MLTILNHVAHAVVRHIEHEKSGTYAMLRIFVGEGKQYADTGGQFN